MAIFHQIWTSEGPNVVKIISARVSDPFLVTFPGGKFWYHDKKNWPTFGPVERPDLPYAHFFYEKIFFRPISFFGRPERPKRPPNAPAAKASSPDTSGKGWNTVAPSTSGGWGSGADGAAAPPPVNAKDLWTSSGRTWPPNPKDLPKGAPKKN